MNKVILFKTRICSDSGDYSQLVRVSGNKSQEQFFQDLKEIDLWWKNEVQISEGDISEDEYIDKLTEYGWNVEYVNEDLEVTF